MTRQEQMVLSEFGLIDLREANRLAYLRWEIQQGRRAEGQPERPLPDVTAVSEPEERMQVAAWIRRLGGGR